MVDEKMVVLIDGQNLYRTARTLGFDIDYKKLLVEFRARGNLLRAKYYTAVDEESETSTIVPLIDWLDYNGYAVVTKPIRFLTDTEGRRRPIGNMDVEIAVDAMELGKNAEHVVLFSGNGDFRCLVEAMQRRGARVTVVSSLASHPAACADELRRQADTFIDLADLKSKIARDIRLKPERMAV
jgi:uncharacterized LabA/DUF88 family protein